LPMEARWKQAADPEADLNWLRRRGVWLEAGTLATTGPLALSP
jgi:hypothetical protein